ncbi:DegT/DnrJ/EryC1/StrS aminotransferase family protein [Bradyrhizobium sp.]|uniref:DegT/DnrJ/EryC1/StrS family aminotransferase n=1 Tax=Bradyrhizobium sp. TaxID=376 RepID=UPI00262D2AC1|nr:DegT/DnrJ/EryC1/StrS aminotransferase family protein [Bradyrhizobium sp.]
MKFPLMRNNIVREDLDALIEYLKQDDPILTNGPNVRAFEQEWSDWLGTRYSVLVNSGASANLLTLAILKIRHPDGGEVIVPPLTWVSDIASVLQNGFTPVFVDIDPRTLAMNPARVVAALTDKTRAVFITHVQGFDGLTDDLLKQLELANVPLIEDVCESHGATHNGRKLGTFGWIANFSFYYAHHMTTIEGGMISTNDRDVYEAVRMFRSHGMVRESSDAAVKSAYVERHPDLNPDFIFAHAAYNVRNTELGGILGRRQLRRLDTNVRRRTDNLMHFLSRINSEKFRTDFKTEGSSNYAFNLVIRKPDFEYAERLMAALRKAGIEFRRGSAGGGNQLRQPYLRPVIPPDHHKGFPEVDHIHFFGFYIGNFPDLSLGEVDEICDVINAVN